MSGMVRRGRGMAVGFRHAVVRSGKARQGLFRLGSHVWARLGAVRCSSVRHGPAVLAVQGRVRLGKSGQRVVRQSWYVQSWYVKAGRALVWLGEAVMAC